jgi:hypothetical protein
MIPYDERLPYVRAVMERQIQTAAPLFANEWPLPPVEIRNNGRGHYSVRRRAIVLPNWLFTGNNAHRCWNQPGYREWYIGHELAHAVCHAVKFPQNHGPAFQTVCQLLTGDAYKWESTYKPKLYAAQIKRTPLTVEVNGLRYADCDAGH